MVDVKVEAEFSSWVTRGCKTEEERAGLLKERADDFNNFIKDHRSQDDDLLSVVPEFAFQCLFCESHLGKDLEEAKRELEEYKKGECYCCNKMFKELKKEVV